MDYIIIVFKNRNNTLKFYNMLKRAGVASSVMATPKGTNINCGICVKTDKKNFAVTKGLLLRSGASGFVGFYKISKQFGRLIVSKL
jgi:hypothetical protein